MTEEFRGRGALVTGGTRGIGREIVLELARRGCRVAFNYRTSEEAALQLISEVEALGSEALSFPADVTDPEGVRSMVEATVDAFGKIDCLVNNAGITRDNLLLRMKDEEWQQVIDINLTGVYNVCRQVVAKMIRKKSGRIVNIGSVSGVMGQKGQVNYSAAKAGLIGFTKALAREIAARRINVNCLAFGFVETEMVAALGEDALAEALKAVPLNRMATPAEAAGWVAFLLSDAAAYMTGQVLCVDGGMSI